MTPLPIKPPEVASERRRLPYSPPILQMLGEVRVLTGGGSSGLNENMSMGTGVNCGTNMSRKC